MTVGILIPGKVEGLPVPGVQFNGHRVFVEVKETSNQYELQDICDAISRVLRNWAAKDKSITYSKVHECDHMWPRPLKGL